MNNDTRTLAVIGKRGLLVEGKNMEVRGEFDIASDKTFSVFVDGVELEGVLQAVLSFVRDSNTGTTFVPYIEIARQSRPTSGTQERSVVSFSKIKRFTFQVEVTT